MMSFMLIINHCTSFTAFILVTLSALVLITFCKHQIYQFWNNLESLLISKQLTTWQSCTPASVKCNYTLPGLFKEGLNCVLTLDNGKSKLYFISSSVSLDAPESQTGTLFSETSAFTRIAAVTPKKQLNAVAFQPEEDEQSSLPELFTGLDGTVTELISTLKLVQQCKDAELAELRTTM